VAVQQPLAEENGGHAATLIRGGRMAAASRLGWFCGHLSSIFLEIY
jgi:hypothetical protein